jgi:branched-chain amino acid transport system substrate-binding protein
MDIAFDKNGDIDRESFLIRVEQGKQQVIATLPALSAK